MLAGVCLLPSPSILDSRRVKESAFLGVTGKLTNGFDLFKFVLAAVIDGGIALASVFGQYESGGACWAALFDIVPALTCLLGWIGMVWKERRPEEPRDDREDMVATFAIVTW